jgi:hemoglobin/transferrin/lactoferrin receptor protein
MKKIFLFILLMNCYALSQQITVKEETTLQPLELVTIYAADLNVSAITDANGNADISRFKKSSSIRFSLLGFEPLDISYQEIAEKNFLVFLEQTPITLGQVLVAANKWDQDRSEIPMKIESIGAQEIKFQNSQTTADMLMHSGTVYIQKSQLGGGSPMIRGFAANRLLIVVDGVRMNNAIFRSGNLQNVIALDPNALENVEVILGPGSVIYGSDALGGVMNFSTLTPRLSTGNVMLGVSALTRYSSAANERTGHLDFSFSPNKNWGFLSSISYTKFGDLVMGSNGPDEYLRNVYQDRINGKDTVLQNHDPEKQINSGYDQINLMQKIRYKPASNGWEFNYGFHYSTSSDVPRYDRLIQPKNSGLRSAQWYYGPQKWMMNQLSAISSQSNSIYDLFKGTAAYQNFEESRNDRRFGREALNHRIEKVNAFSLNLDFLKELNSTSQLFYGAEVVLNKISSTSESENILTGAKEKISTRYPDGSTWNSFGAYLTYKNEINPALIFQSGLRFSSIQIKSEFDTTFFPLPFTDAQLNTSAINGSAGLVWHPQSDLQINLNLSTGFRAPNIDDIGKVFDSEPGAVVFPNPNLKPEYAYSAELGFIKLFSNIIKLNVTGFYTFLDNALIRRDFILNGADSIFYDGSLSRVQAIQNASQANIYGVEFGLDIRLSKGFRLSSNFNYQNGEEEDDTGNIVPLRHSAPWFGITSIIYSADRFKADLYAVYNGEVKAEDMPPSESSEVFLYALDENGNPYSPAWHTLNLKMTYSLLDNLHLNFGVENITDLRYRPFSSGITASGRNFIGSIRVDL